MAVAALLVTAAEVEAAPERIVILRHGEKHDLYRLCDIGIERSRALAASLLGKDAAGSLFAGRARPDAFLAITLHTLELAAPSAAAWGKPVIMYPVLPTSRTRTDLTRALNERTREAAADVMRNRLGNTVVMVWEHHHIADRKLEEEFRGQKVTLRQLLNLDRLDAVPRDWPDDVYDYFWIVDYPASGADTPVRFEMRKQEFPDPYRALPANDWGQARRLPPRCRG
ncbi:MAG: histidine phosphatase family protein [Pseudolabrys sp.]|nr:histidine phosphatase family protein [Pseudolabrys sp.]